MIKDLGCATNVEVINQFLSLSGKTVIDAGCGSMTFMQLLVDLGARVLAVDPDPVQAEMNRAADLDPNIEFVETGAENLPAKNASIDGVFFSYSLHHIPAELYPDVFAEVFRVLKPNGFLYVIEPTDCPLNEVMRLFHNEDVERAAAQAALVELAEPAFDSMNVVAYHGIAEYDSWEQFADHFSSRSFNTIYSASDVNRPEVSGAFERLGGPDHQFASPKQVNYYHGLSDKDISIEDSDENVDEKGELYIQYTWKGEHGWTCETALTSQACSTKMAENLSVYSAETMGVA